MQLQEELSPADAVLLMSSVPERISDLVYGLDEAKLRYRHRPALPTPGGLIAHLPEVGTPRDAPLRPAHPTSPRSDNSGRGGRVHRRAARACGRRACGRRACEVRPEPPAAQVR